MAINATGAALSGAAAPTKQTLASAYIDFTHADTAGWAQQYLPDLMEKEAEVFGNRTVSGFLSQVGAEEGMAADQVIWSEQGRLHLQYFAKVIGGSTNSNTIQILAASGGAAITNHGVRAGDTVVVSHATKTIKCYVVSIDNDSDATDDPNVNDKKNVILAPYTAANLGLAANVEVSLFVYGSEFKKGQVGRVGAVKPEFKSFTNNPIILKDKYEISGSDASQIGWVEVTGEDGQNGYYWYLKAAGDTRARFADYTEMTLLEAEKAASGSGAIGQGLAGTEGLFAAIRDRGNISTAVDSVDDFDAILREFDKNGSIEENMMFLDRTQALAVDDMLAGIGGTNASGNVPAGGGSSYGVFDNDADMALNLGFSGFRRGSYDFYKTDWKYLNDVSTRGGNLDAATGDTSNDLGAIHGVMVPAGVSTVYDQSLGKNLKRPFLHVRYRASQTENRKMKTWTTGSVGAVTSDLDAMEMHFLSERCLVVQGANNFMMLKG